METLNIDSPYVVTHCVYCIYTYRFDVWNYFDGKNMFLALTARYYKRYGAIIKKNSCTMYIRFSHVVYCRLNLARNYYYFVHCTRFLVASGEHFSKWLFFRFSSPFRFNFNFCCSTSDIKPKKICETLCNFCCGRFRIPNGTLEITL